jgi:hypothetical protein
VVARSAKKVVTKEPASGHVRSRHPAALTGAEKASGGGLGAQAGDRGVRSRARLGARRDRGAGQRRTELHVVYLRNPDLSLSDWPSRARRCCMTALGAQGVGEDRELADIALDDVERAASAEVLTGPIHSNLQPLVATFQAVLC